MQAQMNLLLTECVSILGHSLHRLWNRIT